MLATLLNLLVTVLAAAAPDPTPETPPPPAAIAEAAPVSADGDVVVYRPEFFATSRPSTALDMVRIVPGFVIQGGSYGRGLEGSGTNVLIDGRQLPGKGEGIAAALSRIPANSVVSIVRLRGSQPGIDMGGHAEVLNVIRAPRNDSSGVATLSMGRSGGANSRSLNASGTTGRPGRSVSASMNLSETNSGSDAELARDGQPTEAVDSTGQSLTKGGGAALDSGLGADTTFRGNVSLSEISSTSIMTRSAAGTTTLDLVSKTTGHNRLLSGRLDRKLGSALTASVDAVHSDINSESRSDARDAGGTSSFASTSESAETAGGVMLRWKPEGIWKLDAGIDFAINEVVSVTAYGINGSPVPLPGSNIEVSERRIGGELRLGWAPAGAWSANAGLRVNRARILGGGALDDDRSLNEVKPELTVQGRIGAKTSLDIRVAREIDQLAFGAFAASARLEDGTVTLGNPRIDPNRRWVLETTLRRPLFEKAELGFTAQLQRLDNPTEVVRLDSGFDVVDNIGSATAGLLRAQLALPLDGLGIGGARIDLNGSVGTSRIIDPTTGETRRLSGDSRFSWSAMFRHDVQGLPVSYGVSLAGSRSSPSFRPDEIDLFQSTPMMGGYIEYEPRKNISLRAEFNRSGRGSFERIIYSGDRATGALAERQVQGIAATTAGDLTLRVEL